MAQQIRKTALENNDAQNSMPQQTQLLISEEQLRYYENQLAVSWKRLRR